MSFANINQFNKRILSLYVSTGDLYRHFTNFTLEPNEENLTLLLRAAEVFDGIVENSKQSMVLAIKDIAGEDIDMVDGEGSDNGIKL